MKLKNGAVILLIFVMGVVHPQFSSDYKELRKKINAAVVYDTLAKYKNGNLKFQGSIAEFESADYSYGRKIGKFERFYRKGSLMRVSNYDAYGILMNEKFYDPSGGLFCEYELISFKTTASTTDAFFSSINHATFIAKEKNHRYSIRHGTSYLHSEGLLKNGKRMGSWKFFDVHGNLKKEKNYGDIE